MKVKIKELGEVITGNTPSKKNNDFYNSNDILFIKPDIISENRITIINSSKEYISETARLTARIVPKNTILVTCIGSIGKIAITDTEVAFNQQINAIIPKSINEKYLAFCLIANKKRLCAIANAPVVPIINKSQFCDFEIAISDNKKEQNLVVQKLEKISNVINKKQMLVKQLDNLIKSRFVEMFGDSNSKKFISSLCPMTEICEIIDGDRGKNYPKQEDFSDKGFCLFLNAKNVTANGFLFDNCMYISEEKDNILRNGHLNRGDIILTTRGTIGNLAYYSNDIPFENIRINSGMVILRLNREVLNEIFFIEQFKLKLEEIKKKVANGSAQPQLPISTMNKILIQVPNIDKQNEFADFVRQVDKSKFVIELMLKLICTLYKKSYKNICL